MPGHGSRGDSPHSVAWLFATVKQVVRPTRSYTATYLLFLQTISTNRFNVNRDIIIGIATRYGLGGRGIELRWGGGGGGIFHPPPNRPWGPSSNGYRVFPGVKETGAWRRQPTPSSAEVKGSVELYLYSPSGPSWPVLGWTSNRFNIKTLCILPRQSIYEFHKIPTTNNHNFLPQNQLSG